jgi:tetratricopeptide (TPR) repeat protein
MDACDVCTWGTQNLINFWIPALASAAGGILGGLAECATHVKIAGGKLCYDDQEVTAEHLRMLRRSSALIGFAGAWAVLFIFVATRWWETEADRQSLALFVLTMSVAGGFGARRLLPHLANRLKQQIDETSTKAEQAVRKADAANDRAAAAIETSTRTDVFSRARAAISSNANPSDVFKAAEELKGLLKENPFDREAVIPLGNLLSKVGQNSEAVEMLTRFIERKEAANQLDADLADVYFNRACYDVMMWKEVGVTPGAADEFRKRAIADLRVSFRLRPKNYLDAKVDPDLAPLLQDPEYQAMVKSLRDEGFLKDLD